MEDLKLDPYQHDIAQRLERIAGHFSKRTAPPLSIRAKLARFLSRHPDVRGLYIWGGVGRGKTMLMDEFYAYLGTQFKLRLHFHRFMQMVHAELYELAGVPNPLETVAERIASKAYVLCFDEFYVSDIGDAMILSELLKGLFDRHVVLVSTSNIEPKDLYENGLQRSKFLPAIDLLERFTEVVCLDGDTDYRLRALQDHELYRIGCCASRELVEKDIDDFVGAQLVFEAPVSINDREIKTVFDSEGTIGFRFHDLCEGPRSTADYIEIARVYHTVLLYEIPELTERNQNAVRRFIALIDELYDRNVNTVFQAAKGIESLYGGETHEFEFQRTSSRVVEMMSKGYLSRPHRA